MRRDRARKTYTYTCIFLYIYTCKHKIKRETRPGVNRELVHVLSIWKYFESYTYTHTWRSTCGIGRGMRADKRCRHECGHVCVYFQREFRQRISHECFFFFFSLLSVDGSIKILIDSVQLVERDIVVRSTEE